MELGPGRDSWSEVVRPVAASVSRAPVGAPLARDTTARHRALGAVLTSLAAAMIALQGCADPSELQALRAKKAALEAQRAVQQQLAADAALYRDALRQVPEAGMPLDPQEVTLRVTKAADGVAVSVARAPSGGVDVTLSGPASPPRAAVALAQLAQYLPDLSLRSVSVEANGFSAKGSVEPPGPASAPATTKQPSIVPFTEARKLREEVAALEREIAAVTVDRDLLERGPAALRALQSPERFRQQAAVVQKLVGGAPPLAATAELTFEPGLVSARGTLVPGRKVLDGLPLFKADYDAQSMSENAGRFELKLAPRATAGR